MIQLPEVRAIKVREALPTERAEIYPYEQADVETWIAVLEDEGQRQGQICLSRALGQVFGHDTECNAADARGATMLWFAARRKAREWGADKVIVHMDATTPEPLREFWKRLGFEQVMEIHMGTI